MINPIEENEVVSTKEEAGTERKITINAVLWIVAFIILIGIIATYFVEQLPDFVFDLRNVTGQVLFVFLGGFALGELFKVIAMNKAHAREEYVAAKKNAENELDKIKGEMKGGINEYCLQVADHCYTAARNAILDKAKIPVDVFVERYMTLSKREILTRYPDCGLSKNQFAAIKAANAVKKQIYEPDFLQSVVVEESALVPSKRFNTKRKNLKNTLLSVVFGGIGTLFAVSLAAQLIFAFSPEVLFSAIIKILTIVITVAFKVNFGWNLVMVDEINRFALQAKEAQNYCAWWNKRHEVKQPVEGV